MRILHRVAFNGDAKRGLLSGIEELGISYKTSPLPAHRVGIVYFDMMESDSRWQSVVELIRLWKASDVYDTAFEEQEIRNAEWVRLVPSFEQGYPQPEKKWMCDHPNYALRCEQCGAGYEQTGSFRLKKEPRMGKHQFLTLRWTYAFLCTRRVFEVLALEGIKGYRCLDVVIHQTGRPSQVVSQLLAEQVAEPSLLQYEQLNPRVCPECGVVKYEPHRRGYMYLKRDALPKGVDLFESYEWFGSGRFAFRELLISSRLAELILDRKWKGVDLKPVKAV